ncbi:MAG TPA: MarR family transcriptional regulator [Sphingobacteriaceae bacterium]|nr:MarR family transcriptional regulator [Sphingobacteriaceae bacterium]
MASQKDIKLASDLRTTVTRLIKKLRKESVTSQSLSLTERSTLALLDQHAEMLPNELAAMEKITTQSMSQILAHLLELGYINRRISVQDKRKAIISLSEAGSTILYQVRNERDEWLNKALKDSCSAEERELLMKALVPLTKLIDFE